MLMTACSQDTVYSHYEHTSQTGWEKNDEVIFTTEPLAQGGTYLEELGLRINADYPFTQLTLIVQQTFSPSGKVKNDTLDCMLTDQKGNSLGSGISHYQYTFPLSTLSLNKGESVHIRVRHDMKREILLGISDIGIRLTKE